MRKAPRRSQGLMCVVYSRLSPMSGERVLQRRHVRARGRALCRGLDHGRDHGPYWSCHYQRHRYCRRCPSEPQLELRPPQQRQTVRVYPRPALTEACVLQSFVSSYPLLFLNAGISARNSCQNPDIRLEPPPTGTDHRIFRQHPSPHQQRGLSGQEDARERTACDRMWVAQLQKNRPSVRCYTRTTIGWCGRWESNPHFLAKSGF
jgi:hypothetical protein